MPTKFPGWAHEACEIGSLARRSATHIIRKESQDWHYKSLEDLYYRVCKVRTERSARLTRRWDELHEELQNSIHDFRGTENDQIRIERARTAIREQAQREFA
jgi:hypothetical protein